MQRCPCYIIILDTSWYIMMRHHTLWYMIHNTWWYCHVMTRPGLWRWRRSSWPLPLATMRRGCDTLTSFFWHLHEYHTLVKEMFRMYMNCLTCECIPCSNSVQYGCWCLLAEWTYFFAIKFCIWHKRLAGPGRGCVSNHHSEFYSSRRQCAGRNLFWTLNVWNGLCCLNVWQLFWGLKSWKLLLACFTIPLGIMLVWSSRWWGWWWQLRCIEDMSATTASRFDRQQALLLEVRASDVLSRVQRFVYPRNACHQWLSGHRGAWAIWYPSGGRR